MAITYYRYTSETPSVGILEDEIIIENVPPEIPVEISFFSPFLLEFIIL